MIEDLIKTRALIAERKNWTQHTTARNAFGGSAGVYCESAVAFCLYGAVLRAIGEDREGDIKPVLAAMMAANGLHRCGFPADFNDTHEHADILAVVDKTIAFVRASRVLPSLLDIPASPTRVNETV